MSTKKVKSKKRPREENADLDVVEDQIQLVKPNQEPKLELEDDDFQDEGVEEDNQGSEDEDVEESDAEESDVGDSDIPPDSEDSDDPLEFEEEGVEGVAPSTFAPETEKKDNYAEENDTDDEEDLRNTVGKIPMQWYEDFEHIGYDLEGKPISKPIRNQDELDKFLEKMENPNFGRTIDDKMTGTKHVLTQEELDLIERLQSGRTYSSTVDPHAPYVDMFTHEKMIHPLSNAPAHKRSFIPSKLESRKVGKLVNAIKRGWLKIHKPKPEEESERTFYDLWADNEQNLSKRDMAIQKMHVPAPKEVLPSHEASYNPPPEYLPTQEEIDAMENNEDEGDDGKDKRFKLVPKRYDSLRKVPQYQYFIQERFARNLDLYLCPRQRKMKVQIDADDLIPSLPKPSDLRPFPTHLAMKLRGHDGMIRTISVHPDGQWLASGSDDGSLRIWDTTNGRCLRVFQLHELEAIKCVSWCPTTNLTLLAVVVGNVTMLINPCVGAKSVYRRTDHFIKSFEKEEEDDEEEEGSSETNKQSVLPEWKVVDAIKPCPSNIKWLEIHHPKMVGKVVWHNKSDYFSTTIPNNGHMQVIIHQLTKRKSSNPFTKCKGIVQTVAFHPSKPLFFVATQRYVRIYDLIKQELCRKLMCNTNWISSISIHPGGDNLLVGSYDCRLSWMDLDLSSKPYQSMRYHQKAIRSVQFHPSYPLFASASDDASVIIGHGQVYNDLLQNPRIVPVKVLKGHNVEKNVGVLDCGWHPTQPQIFTSGADHLIRLFA